MNKFIQAVKDLDLEAVRSIISSEPRWLNWEEKDGKNALHFVCGVPMIEMRPGGKPIKNLKEASAKSLKILKFLLASGMDMNSVHRIRDKSCGHFPATAVWWAYTRGRNETLYKYLLKQGADPRHCMYAITWYDDAKAAELFKKFGAFMQKPAHTKGEKIYFEHIDSPDGPDSPLLAAFAWKKWKMAEWLLKNGADPNSRDQRGISALFHAVRRKFDTAQIKLLLKYGADPDLQSADGRSARKLADSYRDKTIYRLFA